MPHGELGCFVIACFGESIKSIYCVLWICLINLMLFLDVFMFIGFVLGKHQNLDFVDFSENRIKKNKIIWNLIRNQQFVICWGAIVLAIRI